MTITVGFFTLLVTAALVITMITPVTLLLLFIRDWIKGQLW
jgi:hypothetical protein